MSPVRGRASEGPLGRCSQGTGFFNQADQVFEARAHQGPHRPHPAQEGRQAGRAGSPQQGLADRAAESVQRLVADRGLDVLDRRVQPKGAEQEAAVPGGQDPGPAQGLDRLVGPPPRVRTRIKVLATRSK